MKKLTKKQRAERETYEDAQREAEWAAFEAFRDKFKDLVFKAEVLFFDGMEGRIRGLNGEGDHRLYACNIPGAKTWYPETACVYHTKGQIIDAELRIFYGSGALAVSHTPGTLDVEKWSSLDQTKLAFKVGEDGELETGLFEVCNDRPK